VWAGLPSTLNSSVAASLAKISSVYNQGSLTATSDPQHLHAEAFRLQPRPRLLTPTIRLDWNRHGIAPLLSSPTARTKQNQDHINLPQFPGGNRTRSNYVIPQKQQSASRDSASNWTIRPHG